MVRRKKEKEKKRRRRIIIIIIRNGAKTISLPTLFGRLNNQICKKNKNKNKNKTNKILQIG